MGQKTQLPVCFLDLCITGCLFQGKNLVERCRGALPYSYYRSLLLDCVLSVLVPLFMVSRIGRAIGRRICARGRSGHSRVKEKRPRPVSDRISRFDV
jgi:hypothetical protein